MKRLYVVLLLLACCGEKETHELAPEAFQEQMKSTLDFVVLDVRTDEEISKGFIEGAVQIDYKNENFKTSIDSLAKDKTYFIYCGSGVRSSKAADLMKDLGFTKYYTLEGGIKAWKEKGLPVVN